MNQCRVLLLCRWRESERRGETEENGERTGGFSDAGVFIARKGESYTYTRTRTLEAILVLLLNNATALRSEGLLLY